MNNKGFGVEVILIFIILIFMAFFAFYTFIKTTIYPLLHPKKINPNYKNEYRLYITDHNLNK